MEALFQAADEAIAKKVNLLILSDRNMDRDKAPIPALLAMLEASGVQLSLLTTHHATLEDVFVALTGRHLRDD